MNRLSRNQSVTPFSLFILILFILGGVLSLYHLGQPSLWLDEAYTWWFSSMSWGKLLESVRLDGVNPPLYYIVVKVLTTPFGMSEFTLRFMSTLTNLLAILCAMIIGHRVGGRFGSLAGGWYWAFHPLTIWYARDARPYALAAMFAVVLAAGFLTSQRRHSSKAWVGIILTITLGLLTHYFFVVLSITFVAIAFIDVKRNPIFFRRWTLTALVSFIPLTAWLIWYFTQPQPSLGIGWIQQPNLLDIPATLWNLTSGYGGLNTWPAMLFGGLIFSLMAMALICGEKRRFNLCVFILGILLPIGATWFISQRRPIYHDRYFIVLLPMVLILVSSGAENVRHEIARRFTQREYRLILGGMVLCMSAIGLLSGLHIHLDRKFTKENWRGLTEFIMQNTADRSSILLSEPEALLPLTYYGIDEMDAVIIDNTSECNPDCWWILRQPYTTTHAFSQAITDPYRPWKPSSLEACRIEKRWDSDTGLAAWLLRCPSQD